MNKLRSLNSTEQDVLFNLISSIYPISKLDFMQVVKSMRSRFYKKGELILNLNQTETKNNLVLKGIVHQYVVIDDDIFTIDITLSGMTLCSFTSYVEETVSLQIQEAITDVELIYIEKTESEKLFRQNLPFVYTYLKLLENVHLDREKRSLLLQHKSAQKRYELFVSSSPKSERLLAEVPYKLIASYLNLTPETFSRVRKVYSNKS